MGGARRQFVSKCTLWRSCPGTDRESTRTRVASMLNHRSRPAPTCWFLPEGPSRNMRSAGPGPFHLLAMEPTIPPPFRGELTPTTLRDADFKHSSLSSTTNTSTSSSRATLTFSKVLGENEAPHRGGHQRRRFSCGRPLPLRQLPRNGFSEYIQWTHRHEFHRSYATPSRRSGNAHNLQAHRPVASALGNTRQVFFMNKGGFDKPRPTSIDLLPGLLSDVDAIVACFNEAMKALAQYDSAFDYNMATMFPGIRLQPDLDTEHLGHGPRLGHSRIYCRRCRSRCQCGRIKNLWEISRAGDSRSQ